MIDFNIPPFTGKEIEYMEQAARGGKICGRSIIKTDTSHFSLLICSPAASGLWKQNERKGCIKRSVE